MTKNFSSSLSIFGRIGDIQLGQSTLRDLFKSSDRWYNRAE